MADETQDDKTEEPTQRRMEKAREDGQVLRSQDATMAAVTIMVIAVLYFGGYWFADSLVGLFEGALAFDTIFALEPALAIGRLGDFLGSSLLSLVPLFVLAMITAVGTAAAIGGFVFSGKAVAPKFSKLNPLKGMARIFGLKALVELIKAVLKFSLVGSFAGAFLYTHFEDLLMIGQGDIIQAIGGSIELVMKGALITCMALLVIAAVDITYQSFDFMKKLRMTKQEVRDEMKDIQGQPEVRQKIRQKQREMAEQRMLEDVPSADVIITNPQHFSVALKYDMDTADAPRVVAKGKDFMALQIRKIANEHEVEIFEAPPLARSLYFTTEIGAFIPEALFYSVAQVIAYVYGLNSMQRGVEPVKRPRPKVPKGMHFDEFGNQDKPSKVGKEGQ